MLYDITINNDNSGSGDSASPTDAIDYDRLSETIYESTYSALSDYYADNPLNVSYVSSESGDFPLLEFSSSTDAQLYTVEYQDAPTNGAEQVGAYILDMRNILIIFLFVYLIITIYSKLKNSFNNFLWRS